MVTYMCLTLCDAMDCSPSGCSVQGIFQARILSGLPFPSPGDLPNPGTEPVSPVLAGRFFTTAPPELAFKLDSLGDSSSRCHAPQAGNPDTGGILTRAGLSTLTPVGELVRNWKTVLQFAACHCMRLWELTLSCWSPSYCCL